jgi:DegV family protein with EDD domain
VQHTGWNEMKSFAITTDSNSDLPEEYRKEQEIGLISHYYQIDGEDYGEDNLLPAEEFYDRMRAGSMPTTMASNPAVIRDVFTNYMEQGLDVLHISFSSALSCGCSNVTIGGKEVAEEYPGRTIIVIDSLNVSLGQGLLIMKAAELREQGKTIQETAAWIEEHKMEYGCQFTVDDLFHLYRGGRLSKAAAVFGTMLHIKPILYVNNEGALVALEKSRGRKTSLKKIVDNMFERMGKYRTDDAIIGIAHGDCPEDAKYLEELIRREIPNARIIVNAVSPSIGAHSGPGAVGILFRGEYR